ncbi:MAG: hypothetical protein ACE5GE_10025 [Phycisphaerae bacterium]
MRPTCSSWIVSIATLLVLGPLSPPANAQTQCRRPVGPDVIVGDLPEVSNYGSIGGISAFSIGTTSCNVGDQNLLWIATTNQHPVIAQNMYRLKNDRFEHIGMSWVKHGFFALTQDECGCGCNGIGADRLGVGCSDPYGSGLNGQQGSAGTGGLGPRFQINAFTGNFAFPYSSQGLTGNAIFKRVQVKDSDLDPAVNGGGVYFIEGHYVTPDDAAAGNQNNNASYREVLMTLVSNVWRADVTDATQRERPAIRAWKDRDPTVTETDVQVPGDGLFILAAKAWPLVTGQFHYEYALANLNSDRSGGSFSVPVNLSATVTNIGFHDVDYHSGDGIGAVTTDATDWTATLASGALTWSTQTFAANPNANALRWSTTYNFWFEADLLPETTLSPATIGLFKPGTPAQVAASTVVPGRLVPLTVWLPNGPPASLPPGVPTDFDVRLINGVENVVPATATLHYRFDAGAFQTAPLTPVAGDIYRATIPPTSCQTPPEFYVSATGDGGTAAANPFDAPTRVHTAQVGINVIALADDFEANQGWTVVNENLLDGPWEQGIPVGDGSFAPSADFDGSGQCFQTGNASPSTDVDGGPTRLVSPVINLCGAIDPQLSYARWYKGTSFGSDRMVVEISNDDGNTWVTVETVLATNNWEPVTFPVKNFVVPTGKIRVRFSVTDFLTDSVTEGAVDAFSITDFRCNPALNLLDYQGLANCLQGPTGGSGLGCECFDSDADTHIDLRDYASFQAGFGP